MARKQQQLVEVEGRELTISNVEKVFFPQSGFTKGEVIAFYSEIADTILPHLQDRPLTLKRYPEGIAGEHFYEKNAPRYKPSWVQTFAVPRSEGEGDINYVLCNDRATLIWATTWRTSKSMCSWHALQSSTTRRRWSLISIPAKAPECSIVARSPCC